MVTCQGKCNFDRLSATESGKAVERVEKSKIFPPLPQQEDDCDDEGNRAAKDGKTVERKAFQRKGKRFEKEMEKSIIKTQQGKKGRANRAGGLLVQV